jgi:predicted Rossmann-fold nucleotide-binding protein
MPTTTTTNEEQYNDDDEKAHSTLSARRRRPPPSSVVVTTITHAAEKCALLDPSALLQSDFVRSSLMIEEQQQQQQPVEVDLDVDDYIDITHANNNDSTNTSGSRKSAPVPSVPTAPGPAPRRPSSSLRVCCYGSSSSQTPMAYLQEAATLGFLLAIRGHTCVNGAGSFGCMAAMNDGAAAGNGHIVGVIHEMWLVDGAAETENNNDNDGGGGDDSNKKKKKEWKTLRPLRDGGAHRIFEPEQPAAAAAAAASASATHGQPRREMLVAGGKDLQERKRLLVDKADALIVLPGGPGTWDEVRF